MRSRGAGARAVRGQCSTSGSGSRCAQAPVLSPVLTQSCSDLLKFQPSSDLVLTGADHGLMRCTGADAGLMRSRGAEARAVRGQCSTSGSGSWAGSMSLFLPISIQHCASSSWRRSWAPRGGMTRWTWLWWYGRGSAPPGPDRSGHRTLVKEAAIATSTKVGGRSSVSASSSVSSQFSSSKHASGSSGGTSCLTLRANTRLLRGEEPSESQSRQDSHPTALYAV
eukprot:CAMPEP_0177694382 /NCGR_PEP_ID=MMETSP0484_2-20121128/2904_1 /TAXON_ID=354590 /ORGANISM="Rhodomonas lens, Strain RHODO" /LENGTH=223 /DNA_ID=CAMNT_0019205257 /DNA_START=171 /DNA_END=843 /DNA_ORIENTATION=+